MQHEVRQQAEDRDDHVLEAVEGVVLLEGHDGDHAGDHVEQERAEVADQRDDDQRVGQLGVGRPARRCRSCTRCCACPAPPGVVPPR